MLFNSYPFLLVFLPIALAGFFLVARANHRAAAVWLVLASIAFYAFWSVRALPVLLGSAIVNYVVGRALANSARGDQFRHAGLAAAVTGNLALLGWFKYAGWLALSMRGVLPGDYAAVTPVPSVVLPIGISFFTFTQIAFLVDCRRGLVSEPDFIHYLLFVTYFPHLVAGPVLHHRQMMPQFAQPDTYRPRTAWIASGIVLLTIGLSKKLLLADPLGEYATRVFHNAAIGTPVSAIEAWLATLGYAFQIYFDFSGYTDMALGLSALFGVELPVNFNSPYKATSIIDFWRRWHITLSTFLRDYLYVPLGGNRLGERRRYVNVMTTMVLGGLWHGANWTFVLWGAAHGALLTINQAWRRRAHTPRPVAPTPHGQIAAWLITFIAVTLCWVLFRADSVSAARSMYLSLSGLHGIGSFVRLRDATMVTLLAMSFLICLGFKNSNELVALRAGGVAAPAWQPSLRWLAGAVILFNLCLYKMADVHSFIYFQF